MSAEVNEFEKAPRRLTAQEEARGLEIESTLGQMAYCSPWHGRPWQNPWHSLPCPRVKIGQKATSGPLSLAMTTVHQRQGVPKFYVPQPGAPSSFTKETENSPSPVYGRRPMNFVA